MFLLIFSLSDLLISLRVVQNTQVMRKLSKSTQMLPLPLLQKSFSHANSVLLIREIGIVHEEVHKEGCYALCIIAL